MFYTNELIDNNVFQPNVVEKIPFNINSIHLAENYEFKPV